MRKLPIKLENAVTCLYFASIIWCLLFPVVNITTGEKKPRGIYVDENALLVSSGTSGFPLSNNNENSPQWLNFQHIKVSVRQSSNSVSSFCRFVTSNHASVSCCQIEKSTGTMTKIIVDHPWKTRSLEVTTIAISYHSTNKIQSLAYAAALIERISTSNWLSKRILILLIPLQYDEGQTAAFDNQNSGTQTAEGNAEHSEMHRIRFSPSLSTWLEEYHAMQPRISASVFEVPQQPASHKCGAGLHDGLLRDAYIVDFSEPYITSIDAEHCEGLGGCNETEKGKGEGTALWTTIRVLIAGNNGQLPNMDFIAAPLALFPTALTSEAEVETEQSLSGDLMTNKILAILPKNLLPGFYDSIEELLSRRECRQYLRVMAGLLTFSGTMVEGPSGLHGQFIRRNIDALTLRPIARAPAPLLAPTNQKGRALSDLSHGEKNSHGGSGFAPESEVEADARAAAAASEESEWAVQDLLNLLDIVEQCIRLGSNVNEELHHSLWFYILMGPKLFVGVSEYAGTLLLALCPLLALYFRLTSALKPPRATSTSSSTSSSQSLAPTLPSPSPSLVTVTDLNLEHANNSPKTLIEQLPVTGTMRSSIDLPLLKGLYMFVSDNLPMWILVFIIQPALGHQYLQWCWLTASTVNLLSCSSLVGNAYMQWSSLQVTTRCPIPSAAISDTACCANEGAFHRLEDVRRTSDLTELLTVLTMCLLITLSWVGAQHYALSLLLTLPLVPALCIIVACGTHLGVIDSKIPVPPPIPVCTALPSLGVVTGRTETVSDYSQVLKEGGGGGGGVSGEIHQGVKQIVNNKYIEVENTDITAHTSAPPTTTTRTNRSVPHTDSALAVEGPIRVRELCPLNASELKRTMCRCFLLLLCCAYTPSGTSSVVLYFKRLFLFDPQSLQTTTPYFTALAADWINVEVASLTYPCLLLLPHMICTVSLRVLLADALRARGRGRT